MCRSIRIILDSSGRIPITSKVLNINPSSTIVVVTKFTLEDKVKAIREKGVEVLVSSAKTEECLQFLMEELGKREIDSLLIEGGGEVSFSFFKEDLVDKVVFFIAPKIIGGRDAKTPVEGEGIAHIKDVVDLKDMEITKLGKDIMIEGYVR